MGWNKIFSNQKTLDRMNQVIQGAKKNKAYSNNKNYRSAVDKFQNVVDNKDAKGMASIMHQMRTGRADSLQELSSDILKTNKRTVHEKLGPNEEYFRSIGAL